MAALSLLALLWASLLLPGVSWAVEPEDFLGPLREQASVQHRSAASLLLAPYRPTAGQEPLRRTGPLDPLRARRTSSAQTRVLLLEHTGERPAELVVISDAPHGGFLHEARPGLPGGGFSDVPHLALTTHGSSWLSGDYLPLDETGLPGRLVVESSPFGLFGLRSATRLAYHRCGPELGGCSGRPSWRLAAKGALVPGAGVRDVNGDGRPDLLFVDVLADAVSTGGALADFVSGRAWIVFRLHLQREDGRYSDSPDHEARLRFGVRTPPRFTWVEKDGQGPRLLLGDPAAPWGALAWREGRGMLAVSP